MDTKKLRQKILDLAIRGKLVPQDPNDEPASVLLERIRAEKERLIAEGKIKRPKKSKASSSPSHYQQFTPPFEIPDSWEWVELGEITTYGDCCNVAFSAIGDDEWILELEDLEKDSAKIIQILTKKEREIKGVRHKFNKGDVLYSKLRTYLNKVLVAPNNGYCSTEIIPFNTFYNISTNYLAHVLRSVYFLNYTQSCGYGVKMPRLSTNDACKGMIPLPPVEEQYRIVIKIETLFSILDLIEQNSAYLYSNVKVLKSHILNLAMQGKLVPQDPTDEPAADMLRRINPKAKIITDNPHYPQLPNNWVLTNIETINEYKSRTINPAQNPTQTFELYSVPVFNTGCPEFVLGKTIGSTKQLVKKDDVLLCKINPHLNRVWKIEGDSELTQIASSEWIVVRSTIINPFFLKYYFESENFRKLLCSQVSGVGGSLTRAQPAIVKTYRIPIPPYSEQIRIVDALSSYFEVLNNIGFMLNLK